MSFSPIFVKATYLGLDLVVEQNQRRTFELALNKDECNFFQAGNLVLFHTLHSHFPKESFRKPPDCRKCRSCPIFYVLLPIYVRCINTASESREKIRCDVTLTWTEDLDQGNYNLIRKRMIAGANLFVRNNPELKIAGDWVGGTVTAIPRHSCY